MSSELYSFELIVGNDTENYNFLNDYALKLVNT